MFYADECVHTQLLGHGRVARSGHDPLVRFPGGIVKRISGDTLRVVSAHEYEEQLANRIWVNEWTFQYVYGQPLPPGSFDDEQRTARPLAVRMVEAAKYPDIHTTRAGVAGADVAIGAIEVFGR